MTNVTFTSAGKQLLQTVMNERNVPSTKKWHTPFNFVSSAGSHSHFWMGSCEMLNAVLQGWTFYDSGLFLSFLNSITLMKCFFYLQHQ